MSGLYAWSYSAAPDTALSPCNRLRPSSLSQLHDSGQPFSSDPVMGKHPGWEAWGLPRKSGFPLASPLGIPSFPVLTLGSNQLPRPGCLWTFPFPYHVAVESWKLGSPGSRHPWKLSLVEGLLRVPGGCSADHCFAGYLHLSESGDSLVVVGRVSGGYGDHK